MDFLARTFALKYPILVDHYDGDRPIFTLVGTLLFASFVLDCTKMLVGVYGND